MFTRIGDATDVVTKEMYDFVDKGERHIALRPEMTASVCRAFAEHRPTTPWKVFYSGPNFRYEKPQRGRYRQFDQVGVEVLGADDPNLDVEVIALAWEFYPRLGLHQVTLIVNSLGEPDDRARYVEALREHFVAAGDALTEQSRATLERNPLRVLDSKRDDRPAAHRRRAADRRLPQRRRRRALRRGARRACERSTSRSRSSPSWSVASTTTAARSSSSRAAPSTRRRTRSAAVAATTASSKRSAARRPRASGSRSASIARCSPATTRASFAAEPVALDAFVVDVTGGLQAVALTAELRAAGFAVDRGYDNRSMKAQMKLANRSGARVRADRRRRRTRRRHRRRQADAGRRRPGRRRPVGNLLPTSTPTPDRIDALMSDYTSHRPSQATSMRTHLCGELRPTTSARPSASAAGSAVAANTASISPSSTCATTRASCSA